MAEETTSADCTDESTLAVTKIEQYLVIIIDDLGHNLRRGEQALALPAQLTVAIMPNTQHGEQLALSAHSAGKEVMLHAPMSSEKKIPLDHGGLSEEMSREEFRYALHAGLEQVPHARGINNHMGSELTQKRQQMAWLMQDLRALDLYFVDSRTSDKTVAATVAAEFNVPNLSRQVFLDNERTAEAIDLNFKLLLKLAEKEGLAVAIGHPYPETISYLREALSQLPPNVTVISVSQALSILEDSAKAGTVDHAEIVKTKSTGC